MNSSARWLAFFLLSAFWAGAFPAGAAAQSQSELKYWRGKAAVLQLKDGEILAGKIVTVKKDGVIFDPRKVSFLYNPPPKFYPFSKVQKLVQKDGQIVYQAPTPSQKSDKIRRYTVSLLGSHHNAEHSTYSPIVLQVNAFSERGEFTATFVKSFNVDEGVGCCECWSGELPSHHYRVRYSSYFLKIGSKIPIKNGGFEFGFVGGLLERGWCDASPLGWIPPLPYAGVWGEISRHFSIGLKVLALPVGVFTAGATYQSANKLSNVWVGVLYFGETVPRWRKLRPSFRAQLQVRKKWLLHVQMYRLNQPHSSNTSKLLLFGIGRVFNRK